MFHKLIIQIIVLSTIFQVELIHQTIAHVVGDKSDLTALQKACEHAYKCFHDTVPVCGSSSIGRRTFLDLCDLYEYVCEYNQVYRHVKEDKKGGCPDPNALAQ